MKKVLVLIAFVLPVIVKAQSIDKIEVDKFTNQKRVLTKDLLIINRPAKWPHLSVRFRSVDTTCYMNLIGENIAVGIIGASDIAFLLLADKSKIVIHSTGIQAYTPGTTERYYDHQYAISRSDVLKLAKQKITSVRIYFENRYEDVDIDDKHAEKVVALADLFHSEIVKF